MSVADASSDPRIGQLILERYEIVRPLAEGGMGAVYEARHRELGRRFAVKFLRAELRDDPKLLARFRQEARTAGELENEHIAAIVDLGTAPDGAPCLVMEYLDGQSIERLLQSEGPLPIARAAAIVRQICAGLRIAHAHGVVHRDLKPKNVIVCAGSFGRDVVKIVDFGIAKTTKRPKDSTTTTTGATLGTPHYMSPEQARGEKKLDQRTDIYALGVLLYELLTGNHAHPGDSYNAIIYHILSKQPEPIRSLRPDVPEGLARIVQHAMAADAADRYASVDELSSALEPYAPGATAMLQSDADTFPRARAATVDSISAVRRPRRVALVVAFVAGVGAATVLAFSWPRASATDGEARPAAVQSPPAMHAEPTTTATEAPFPAAVPIETPAPAPSSSVSAKSAAPAKMRAAGVNPQPKARASTAAPPSAQPAPSKPFDWRNPYE